MSTESPRDVIPIPGHLGMWARRAFVDAWQRAGSPRLVSAGRLYGEQKALYDGWRSGLPGYNPADNPDDERQRLAHVRFVAGDLDNPAHDAPAMRRAGLVFPYPYEPWHAELPGVLDYPLVRELPKPIITTQEDDMDPIYAGVSAASEKYEIRGGRKRSISQAEWKAIRLAEKQGRPVYLVTLSAAELASIPGA